MVCIICFQVQYCKDSENPVLYNPHTGMVSLYNGNVMSLRKVFHVLHNMPTMPVSSTLHFATASYYFYSNANNHLLA